MSELVWTPCMKDHAHDSPHGGCEVAGAEFARLERERDEARAGRVAARAEVELLREARREEHREASAAAAYSARRQTEMERDLATAEARVAALEKERDEWRAHATAPEREPKR